MHYEHQICQIYRNYGLQKNSGSVRVEIQTGWINIQTCRICLSSNWQNCASSNIVFSLIGCYIELFDQIVSQLKFSYRQIFSREGVTVHVFQAKSDLKRFQNEGDWIMYLVGLLRSLIFCNHHLGVFPLDASFNECVVSCGRRLSNHSLLWRFDCDLEF